MFWSPVADDNGFAGTAGIHRAVRRHLIGGCRSRPGRISPLARPQDSALLPAVTIGAPKEANSAKAIESALKAKNAQFDSASSTPELAAILHDIHLSTWELPHRHIDGWLRYANTSDGTSLWSQPDSDAYKNVTSADPATIARVFNSLLWDTGWQLARPPLTDVPAPSPPRSSVSGVTGTGPCHQGLTSRLRAYRGGGSGGQLVMQSGGGRRSLRAGHRVRHHQRSGPPLHLHVHRFPDVYLTYGPASAHPLSEWTTP